MNRKLKEILEENTEAAKQRVTEIHAYITDEVDANAKFDFDSASKTAEWSLWIEIVSVFSYLQELLWSDAKAELELIKETGIAANKYFFAREWSGFQYGDDLIVNDDTGKYSYAVVDEAKQIIKRLAILQSTNRWSLKVATEDGNGNPIALSAEELAAFQIFVDRTQPPGAKVNVISIASDKADVKMTIYFNALEPLADLKPLVEAAYLKYLAEIDINGESIYYRTKHIDEVQLVNNVKDVIISSAQSKIDGQSYTNIERRYEPFSGYLELDPALTLDDLITYLPE